MTESHLEERVGALHFIHKFLAIFVENNCKSLFINWWRFRFFFQSVIRCLVEIIYSNNKKPILMESNIVDINNATNDQEQNCKEK